MSVDGDIQEKGKYPTPTKEEESVPEFVESLGQIYDKYKDQGVEGIALSLPRTYRRRKWYHPKRRWYQISEGRTSGRTAWCAL